MYLTRTPGTVRGLPASWWLTVVALVLLTWAIMAIGYAAIVHARPCTTEDSGTSCTWYADEQGSAPGGATFTDIGGVVVIYWPR